MSDIANTSEKWLEVALSERLGLPIFTRTRMLEGLGLFVEARLQITAIAPASLWVGEDGDISADRMADVLAHHLKQEIVKALPADALETWRAQ